MLSLEYPSILLTSQSFVVPTPFASHAFHPLDGYLQSVPYHVCVFVFPFHRILYLGLFVVVNFWTIFVRLSLEFTTEDPPELTTYLRRFTTPT
jgi:Delta7-sterol 5-desaturase